MNDKIAVCPGSFDPITIGHIDIIKRALPVFDKIIVALGFNQQKKYLFDEAKRTEFINKIFENEPKISCASYKGLTVNFCKTVNAKYLIRGLRSSADFEYEKGIALLNQSISEIETIFLISRPQYSHISSSIVREIIINGGNARQFLPDEVQF